MKNTGTPIIKKSLTMKQKRGIRYLIAAIPFAIFTFMFSYAPLFGWWLAFTDYKIGMKFGAAPFVGLVNFAKMMTDPNIPRVLRNTLVMSGLSLLTSPLAILFAIMLGELKHRRTQKFVQTMTTLPNFISWIIVFGLAQVIFSGDGLLNDLLGMFGIPQKQGGIIGDGDLVWGFQLGLQIWKGLGWSSIIYLAAIAGIDTELYDAAKVDGADKLQRIRYITIPGVLPTYLVLLLLDIGSILSCGFDQYYQFWNSLTADKIEVLDYYVYKAAFQMGWYPYSIALGMIKSLISIVLLSFVNWLSKKIRGYSLV